MGTLILGFIGFPLFIRGLLMLRRAQREGLSVRPVICTLIGYLVIIDSALNSIGWTLDLVAHHSLIDPHHHHRLGCPVRWRLLLALQ